MAGTFQDMSKAQFELDDFSVVGFGALGRALCRALPEIGLRLDFVFVRDPSRVAAISDETDAGVISRLFESDASVSSLLLICVPDDVLQGVAEGLAKRGDWRNVVVLHTSGVLAKDVLKPLEKMGASVGSFHPLQTFTGGESLIDFKAITIGIEGGEEVVAVGRHLANALMAQPIVLSSSKKALYHASAVLAGNAVTTLMSVAEEIWEQAAGTREGFSDSMGPLIRRSVENTLDMGPDAALSGPIARGDVGTLKRHLKAVSECVPHLISLYGSVAVETVHLAVRSGRISADQAVGLLDAISEHLADP